MEIMIAGKEGVSRHLIEQVVAEMGHLPHRVDNAADARAAILEGDYPVLIAEASLLAEDGFALCRLLRTATHPSAIQRISLCIHDGIADLGPFFAAGVDDVVWHPIDPDVLKAKLRNCARRVRCDTQLNNQAADLAETRSRLKILETQMLRQEKMAAIGQLVAGVAHEIKNPTGFVDSNLLSLKDYIANVDALLEGYKQLVARLACDSLAQNLSADIRSRVSALRAEEEAIDINFIREDLLDLIEDCREGTRRIKKIVFDLKAFAHPGEEAPQYADINAGLQSTLNVVNAEIKYKAKVMTDFGEVPLVECVAQELNQVFMNLFVNAAQAMETRGEISVRTRYIDDRVRIEIGDTGSGIAPEHLDKIFDPFFTTKAVGQGTGLGMHIAAEIIAKHQGAIRVESEVGAGTTFFIDLPVADDRPALGVQMADGPEEP